MLKNRTKQELWKILPTGITVKIYTNQDGVRAIQRLSCGSSRLAHLRSSHWSKPQNLHRPPYEWTTNNSLFSFAFQCVGWKVTSVTAVEFYGVVIPRNLYVPVISAETFHFPILCLRLRKIQTKVVISTCLTIFFRQKVSQTEFNLFHRKTTFSTSIYWCVSNMYGGMYDVALHNREYS